MVQDKKHERNSAMEKAISEKDEAFLRKISALDGKDILNAILDQENSRQLVQKFPESDFYWLLKKIGEEDCIPLLEMGSKDQWQYVLDMEMWKKDRMDIEQTFKWLNKMLLADHERLARWIFSDLIEATALFLFRSIQVDIRDEENAYDIKEGFFTLDGTFYIKPIDEKMNEYIQALFRSLANVDISRYHNLIINLGGILPAETEEELYRIRNVRLAEHGFLPYEEAIAIYSALDQRVLDVKQPSIKKTLWINDEETTDIVPVIPISYAKDFGTLITALSHISNPVYIDKLKLEFAALCNTILSTKVFPIDNFDILVKTCREAAGYVNIALEQVCRDDQKKATEVIINNPLEDVFRVGFGLALKLKWEAEKWIEKSWFKNQGFSHMFWGDLWGNILSGLLLKRPMFYSITGQKEDLRGFERLSEIEECKKILDRMIALDTLMENLDKEVEVETEFPEDTTFIPLLFNFWARKICKMQPSFAGIGMKKARELFEILRSNNGKTPPFQMSGFRERFVSDLLEYVPNLEHRDTIGKVLGEIWEMFRDAFGEVRLEDLDPRYMRDFIWIKEEEVS